jgi:peptidoglycan hydrolase-like protein with peptidoglycan-binding domain
VGLTLLLALGLFMCNIPASAATKASSSPQASAAAKGSNPRVKKARHSRRRRQPGQKVPTADRITEIQQALAKDGSFKGNPNGKWDAATVEAMRKFQTSHGLNPTGKLDAVTLQKLGLGSKTAGVAAPMPPVTSSSLAEPAPAQSAPQQ